MDFSKLGSGLSWLSKAGQYSMSDLAPLWRNQNPYSASEYVMPPAPQQSSGGFWDAILNKAKTKSMDYLSDPSNLLKLGIGGIGGIAGYMSANAAAKRQKQFDDFRMQMAQQQNQRYLASEAQFAKYDAPRAYASARKKVVAPTVLPSGEVVYFEDNQLTGEQLPEGTKTIFAAEGGYMGGGTTGQSDKIPAMLSDGEFVVDADTVAALGDGNNAAGASALEQMRQNVRKHKRSAPVNKIPPKAKKPEQYMKKGK